MASLVYNEAFRAIMAGEIDLNADDIRAALVMTNTTADTETDAIAFVGDFTTLDECDDGTYARQALANEAVNKDDANDRAEFDADDVTFSNTGDATRSIDGILIYKHVTNDADSIPICFVDISATLDGNDLVVAWNPEGILQLAQA